VLITRIIFTMVLEPGTTHTVGAWYQIS